MNKMSKIIIVCLTIIGFFAFAESCANEGQMCAGIAGIQCCSGTGLRCYANDTSVADYSGKCIKGCRQAGESCGGIAGLQCCNSDSVTMGLRCHIVEKHLDAMGKCARV